MEGGEEGEGGKKNKKGKKKEKGRVFCEPMNLSIKRNIN